jgi:hypothetical protein
MGRIKELELELARHKRNERDDDWTTHFRLRLAYENAMLEAVGGRASSVDMVVGGWWGEMRIHGVNRSTVTGNVTSLDVFGPYHAHRRGNLVMIEGLHKINIERDTAGRYRSPTPEELAEFEAARKADKKAKREAKKDLPPEPKLTNPTQEEAQRLQDFWNEQNEKSRAYWGEKPGRVFAISQENYSAGLKSGACKTVEIVEGGKIPCSRHDSVNFPTVVKIRTYRDQVVVLTDKPQAALPPSVWIDPIPAALAALEEHVETIAGATRGNSYQWAEWDAETTEIIKRARMCKVFNLSSMTQFGLTETGHAWVKRVREKRSSETLTA